MAKTKGLPSYEFDFEPIEADKTGKVQKVKVQASTEKDAMALAAEKMDKEADKWRYTGQFRVIQTDTAADDENKDDEVK